MPQRFGGRGGVEPPPAPKKKQPKPRNPNEPKQTLRAGAQQPAPEMPMQFYADRPGMSLLDVQYHRQKPAKDSCEVILRGGYQGDKYPAKAAQGGSLGDKAMGSLSGLQDMNKSSRDPRGVVESIPVDYFGPDTPFKTEELNPHHYGRDHEPSPLKDYKKYWKWRENSVRLQDDHEYEELQTPGAVGDKALESSLAYGAWDFNKVDTDCPDNRSFDSQNEYRRLQFESIEMMEDEDDS